MKAVAIRELKNRLSEYLRQVRAGEEILVTDRGEVVAEIRRPGRHLVDSPYPALVLYAQRTRTRLGAPNRAEVYPRLKPALSDDTIRRLLDEERGGI
jgi:antitoxin (DNA-binding transcriptional repressor) of toxin-antitoxin stability system